MIKVHTKGDIIYITGWLGKLKDDIKYLGFHFNAIEKIWEKYDYKLSIYKDVEDLIAKYYEKKNQSDEKKHKKEKEDTIRCEALTISGNRCNNKKKCNNYCHIHIKKNKEYVNESDNK